MHLLYEEDGEIKAGTVHTSTAASHQIDTPHGRRVKIKIAQVVLEFSAPSPAELLAAAHAFAKAHRGAARATARQIAHVLGWTLSALDTVPAASELH